MEKNSSNDRVFKYTKVTFIESSKVFFLIEVHLTLMYKQ